MIAPDVALTITCTVVGVPVAVIAVGDLYEEEQPPTASVRLAAIAISSELRTNKERLRNPANARMPSGVENARVTPPTSRDTLPASYGFGMVGEVTSAMDTVTLSVPVLARFAVLGVKLQELSVGRPEQESVTAPLKSFFDTSESVADPG